MIKNLIKLILILILFIACEKKSQVAELETIVKTIKNDNIKDSRLEYINIDVEESDDKGISVTGETSVANVKSEIEAKMASMNISTDIKLLPHSDFETDKYAVLKLSVIPIRRYPRHSAEQVDQAIMGSVMKLFQKRNGWYLIQTNYDYFGWIPTSSVVLMDEAKLASWKSSNLKKYMGSFEFVTEDKNFKGRRLVDIGLGNVVKIIESKKSYAKVELVDGRQGYVSNNFSDFDYNETKNNPKAEDVLELAKTFLGLPYLWGGNSTKGVDCSGFTQSVFKNNGLLLPRDADQQSFTGEKIEWAKDFSNLKSGDLLFFGPNEDRITHVAISLGDKKFIHSSGEVKINTFDENSELYSEYLLNNLRKVRRILNSKS